MIAVHQWITGPIRAYELDRPLPIRIVTRPQLITRGRLTPEERAQALRLAPKTEQPEDRGSGR